MNVVVVAAAAAAAVRFASTLVVPTAAIELLVPRTGADQGLLKQR